MTDGLIFSEDRHEYRFHGRLVPSVTQILEPLSAHEYRGVDRQVMERAAQLGRAVHRMIELDLAGTLDTDSLAEPLLPYLDGWRNFLATSGFEASMSEQRVYSQKYGYAGTLDLFGWLNSRLSLIDAKRTAQVPRTAGPQTAAYEAALRECHHSLTGTTPIDRYALHLLPGGNWRLVPFTDKADLRTFLACATIHAWKNHDR